jgi:hypothetical protein
MTSARPICPALQQQLHALQAEKHPAAVRKGPADDTVWLNDMNTTRITIVVYTLTCAWWQRLATASILQVSSRTSAPQLIQQLASAFACMLWHCKNTLLSRKVDAFYKKGHLKAT